MNPVKSGAERAVEPLTEGPGDGIRSRSVDNGNGLQMHVLEAGDETPGCPTVLLLHGFPELAYSWRKVMPALAQAGYRVIAPDQRGYGGTLGARPDDPHELDSFGMMNLVRDALGLLAALGVHSVDAVIGHDFGSPVAAWCALIRPDVFRSVVMMSAPFGGPPGWPAPGDERAHDAATIVRDLASLARPRQHYVHYYAGPDAERDLDRPPQGAHDFLRAYFHHKSADWRDNRPEPLAAWTAQDLARLPSYYVMDLGRTMPETVASEMPSAAQIAGCTWLPDAELAHYSRTFERTGFGGGLRWYRAAASPQLAARLRLYAGRTIDVPALFIAGRQDWGVHQKPGELQRMQTTACRHFAGCHLIDGAGHWVQQERAPEVARLLIEFLDGPARRVGAPRTSL